MHKKIVTSFLFIFLFISCFSQSNVLKFRHLDVSNGLPQSSVYSIVQDRYGFMWFGTWGGAVRYDGYATKTFRPIENDSTALSDYRISCIVTDNAKDIWIETENNKSYYKYDYAKEYFIRYEKHRVPHDVYQKIISWHKTFYKRTDNGVFEWTTSQTGLQQRDLRSGEVHIYQRQENNLFALSDNVTKNVFLDDQQNLWVGTQSGGVNFAAIFEKPFKSYMGGKSGSLIENSIRAVTTDKNGRIWSGAENGGITIVNSQFGVSDYQVLNSGRLKDIQVRALYCDEDNNVWVGTKSGILVFKNGRTLVEPKYDQQKLNDKIFAISEDYRKNLWIGTLDGLVLFDRKKERFAPLLKDKNMMGRYIRCIVHDGANNTWVATEDMGVSHLIASPAQVGKYHIVNYRHDSKNTKTIAANRTYSLTIDRYGKVWVATDRGVSVINPLTNDVRNFTVRDHLSDDLTMAVAYDEKHSIWISHKKGLSKIDIRNYRLQNYDFNDGLQGNEFNQSASYYDARTKTMFFGGSNGLTGFQPQQIRVNPFPPRVALIGLRIMHQPVIVGKPVNGRIVLERSLLCTDSLTLTWWDKVFEIEFAALHFGNYQGNRYKYMLEGFDKKWIEADAKHRTAAYANLPSGNYTLKIMASNSDGVWNKEPRMLHIRIMAPWWTSAWAITGYVSIGISVFLLLLKYIISRLKLRQNERLHQAKLRFFTGVSHEFRTPITLIVDPLHKLLNEKVSPALTKQYYELMHRNAQQLLLLVNQLLDFNKLDSGQFRLDMKPLELISFLRSTIDTFRVKAQTKNIQLTMHSDMSALWSEFDEQKLNMIMNNLLSNAIKFTPEQGKIIIGVKYYDAGKAIIGISVTDTGVGISATAAGQIFELFYQTESSQNNKFGSGIGLALTKELVKLHGGEISVKSEEGKGSTFLIQLPLTSTSNSSEIVSDRSEVGQQQTTEMSCTYAAGISEKPVVLFVDDNEDIRKYFDLNFSLAYHLEFASNGREGLAKALACVPDLIVSDVMMPDMDGLTFCGYVKAHGITSHIPFLMLTAKQSDQAKAESYQTGADGYIAKPFSTEVLRARIANLLAQRKLLRELFDKQADLQMAVNTRSTSQEAFLNEVRRLIDSNLQNKKFDIDFLAVQLGMSRSQFYRKMKALTDRSINEFVLEFQMKKAGGYLLSGDYAISEVAYMVGYQSPNSFTRAFVKYFGVPPSKYIGHHKRP